MKTFVKIHFSRIVVITAVCLSATTSLCQIKPVEKPLGNTTLQKIIEVRTLRDSVDKKQDSLMLKLDKAIAAKNKAGLKKK